MVDLKITLPEGFLNEEVRSGYRVSHETKKVWAVELDLLAEFQRVCQKHKIKYIASGGTMLGAVRHKGFIPWDDDIDLMLMREEYDKLCEIAPSEFKHPYFFQTSKTDLGYFKGFARLRNSETTAIFAYERDSKFRINQGIFIDIFPMDNVVDDKELLETQSNNVKALSRKVSSASYYNYRFYRNNTLKNKIQQLLLPIIKKPSFWLLRPDKKLELFEKECQRYNNINTKYVGLLTFQFNNRLHDIEREDMNHLIESDFEFLKIPNIANYDKALRWKYGDYMTPVNKPSYHEGVFFDANHCYKDYLNGKLNY